MHPRVRLSVLHVPDPHSVSIARGREFVTVGDGSVAGGASGGEDFDDVLSVHWPSPLCVSIRMPSRTGVWHVRVFGRPSIVITHSKQTPIPQ